MNIDTHIQTDRQTRLTVDGFSSEFGTQTDAPAHLRLTDWFQNVIEIDILV